MPADKKAVFSVSSLLSGYLEAFFGAEFAFYLSTLKQQGERRLFFIPKNFTFEQQKVINLLQIIEDAFNRGKMENVKKYTLVLLSLLKDLYNTGVGKLPLRFRQKIFLDLLYKLFVQIGDYLLSQGLAAEALIFYEELLNRFPEDTFLIKKAARAYFLRGPFFGYQAERLYRRALLLHQRDLEAYEALGRLLENFPERKEEAVWVYKEALHHCRTDMSRLRFYLSLLSLSPGDNDLLLRLGKLFLRQGSFLEARRYLEEAFQCSKSPWAAFELGRVCLLLNELGRAKEAAAFLWGKENLCPSAYYLYALIAEFEEEWDKALENYQKVPEEAEYYWQSRIGAARALLQEGRFTEAFELAQQLPGAIPAGEKGACEKEYLELCKLIEDAAPESSFAGAWREILRQKEPDYELKKDIHKRNMGGAFWRKYEFQEVLGEGPWGEVFLARERKRGSGVVIKGLDPKFLSDSVIIRRIQGFLRTWRRLNLPYLVRIYEDCYFNNRFFFAMEYMEGGSLAALSRLRAPLPLKDACAVIFKVSCALEELYLQGGSCHGNLKPQNILFTAEGDVKVSDFDLLWLLEGTRVFGADILKKYPFSIETFLYAAPERFSVKSLLPWRKTENRYATLEAAVGGGADHRADLYSLGVIFFELLTGFLPYKKNSVAGVIRFHRYGRRWPSLRLFNPALPPEVEQIVLKLLNRNPEHRYATPTELKEALKKVKNMKMGGAFC